MGPLLQVVINQALTRERDISSSDVPSRQYSPTYLPPISQQIITIEHSNTQTNRNHIRPSTAPGQLT
jgi:hypothetical protein